MNFFKNIFSGGKKEKKEEGKPIEQLFEYFCRYNNDPERKVALTYIKTLTENIIQKNKSGLKNKIKLERSSEFLKEKFFTCIGADQLLLRAGFVEKKNKFKFKTQWKINVMQKLNLCCRSFLQAQNMDI